MLEQIQGKLRLREVVISGCDPCPRRGLPGRLQHPAQRGRLAILRRLAQGIGGDTVPGDPPPLHLFLHPDECGADAGIELPPGRFQVLTLSMGVLEEVFGVMEQADIQARQLQALQGSPQLVLQKPGMDAMPATSRNFHHLGEGIPRLLPLPGQIQIAALHIADLGDDDLLLPVQIAAVDRLLQHLADAGFAAAVGIVRGGVDEIAPFRQGAP